jgi:hypothetical protein
MLRERRVGNLRAAVCTFPSPDRLGGILELLADGHPVRECWLPARLGVLEGMARSFNRDWPGWFSLFGAPMPRDFRPPEPTGSDCRFGAAMLMTLAAAGCPGEPLPVPNAGPEACVAELLEGLILRAAARRGERGAAQALRRLGKDLSKAGGFREQALLCCSLLLDHAGASRADDADARVVKGLTLAAMTAVLTTGTPRVRYFQRSHEPQYHLIPRHPVMCLNGTETDLREPAAAADPEHLYREAGKLFGNGRGLVFLYGDGRCGTLFCGNSQLLFAGTGNGIPLRRPTVITAPGQGAVSLEEAYARIRSDAPEKNFWVRAHYSHARKVSEAYKQLPNRFCLSNPAFRSMQEVVLEFDGDRWHRRAGKFCTCK